jgi:hypothetical protein
MPTGARCLFIGETGSDRCAVKAALTQAVWKRFSSPKNCKQPGAMDLDATV